MRSLINPQYTEPGTAGIEILDLPIRAHNVLMRRDIKTIEGISEMHSRSVRTLPGAGEECFKEIARRLMIHNRRPQWLQEIAFSFKYPEAQVEDEAVLEKSNWNCITSSFNRAEYWMLEGAISSLEAGKIEYKLVRLSDSGGIKLYRRGGIPTTEED